MATLVRCLSGVRGKRTQVVEVEVLVAVVGETGEPRAVEVHRQGLVGDGQGVDTHVELPAADAQRLSDVFLADVGVDLLALFCGVLPLGHVAGFGEEEDPLALALGGLG